MEKLKQKILKEGQVIQNGNILKVDSFIDHQIDPILMEEMASVFVKHFTKIGISEKITKILTVETSGIAVAAFVGLKLKIPVIYARKKIPVTLIEKLYSKKIVSPTKGNETEIVVSSKFLGEKDKVYIIDDFLATGETSLAILEIITEAKAVPLGVGALIENAFLHGSKLIREKYPNLDLFTLVKIKSMSVDGTIEFA